MAALSGGECDGEEAVSKESEIFQIIVECVREDDGSLRWVWDAYSSDKRLFGGAASNLSRLLNSMCDYLCHEGYAP